MSDACRKKIGGKIVVDHKKCSGANICSEHGICIEKCPAHALKPEGERKTVAEIMEIIMQDLPFYEESGGGVTLSGGEATMQPEFAIELLKALKAENIHTRQGRLTTGLMRFFNRKNSMRGGRFQF